MALFGWLKRSGDGSPETPAGAGGLVSRVASQLDRLPPETVSYVAAFAYVLGRIAHADRHFSSEETGTMVDLVQMSGHLTGDQAALVVEIAKAQHRLFAGDDKDKVTRQFREMLTDEQRQNLLHCMIAVAAADQTISIAEEAELKAVARDLDLDREEFEMILKSYDSKREKKDG
jgi:uncharacterized tellurite resistance protein B-like protein